MTNIQRISTVSDLTGTLAHLVDGTKYIINPGVYDLGSAGLDIGTAGDAAASVSIEGLWPPVSYGSTTSQFGISYLKYSGTGVAVRCNRTGSFLGLKNLFIDCLNTANGSTGIAFYDTIFWQSRIERNTIVNAGGWAMDFPLTASSSTFVDGNNQFRDLQIFGCTNGIRYSASGTSLGPLHGSTFQNCAIQGILNQAGGIGFQFGPLAGFGNRLLNCYIVEFQKAISHQAANKDLNLKNVRVSIDAVSGAVHFDIASGAILRGEGINIRNGSGGGLQMSGAGRFSFFNCWDGTSTARYDGRISPNFGLNEAAPGGNSTTKAITLAYAEPDANYCVLVTPHGNQTVWVTSKTFSGFNLNYSAKGGIECDWQVTR